MATNGADESLHERRRLLAQRGALGLEQRADEERVVVELHGTHAALVVARRDLERSTLQPTRVARIEPVVAVVLLVRGVAPVDGSQPRAGLELETAAHLDERARERRDHGVFGLGIRFGV